VKRWFLQTAGVDEPVNVCCSETNYVGSRRSNDIFLLLDMFYTHKHSKYAVTHPLFHYSFKSYLRSNSRVRNAIDADVSVILRIYFFFVYRNSYLECSCSNET